MRTIGVLTKPDLIGPGNEDEVLAVLHNIRKPLKLGCVGLALSPYIPFLSLPIFLFSLISCPILMKLDIHLSFGSPAT